ncbi:hypothetical protein SEUCBS140593_010098 [Sporothrix eucalyptigena]|uniref:Transglutaminase-like domain-containing protein n=1 Tax=Sporothrix eucalyptigena TaxID=1812306 RepID=A0ABP0D125_9PEZI
MTEVEEPQFSTLAERIAALNKQKNFSSGPPAASTPPPINRSSSTASTATTTSTAGRRPPPPPPVSSSVAAATKTLAAKPTIAAKPVFPKPTVPSPSPKPAVTKALPGPPPKLPPRQPSSGPGQTSLQRAATTAAIDRRPSADSVRSHLSTGTTVSRVSSVTSHSQLSNGEVRKLPPAFGTTKLPALPPTRREREAREKEEAEKEAQRVAEERAAREQERERERAERERSDREREDRERAEWERNRNQNRDRDYDRGYDRDQNRDRDYSRGYDRDQDRAPALPTRPGSNSARRPQFDRNPSSRSQRDDEGPALPPRLPPRRPTNNSNNDDEDEGPAPALPSRRNTVKSALELGFNSGKSLPRRPGPQQVPYGRRREDIAEEEDDDAPPPLAPRPTRAQVDAAVRGGGGGGRNGYIDDDERRPNLPSRPRPRANGGGGAPGFYPKKSEDEECMKCRDFTGPDTVAAQFPISSLPRRDTVNYLAHNLCDDFPSQTDKARAIFAWCHHNIAYDVEGFFGGCIPRGQSMEERIFSGKAVCEGYARVYEAVALAAGLECEVVTGHGKGFGFDAVLPGQPIPPRNPTGHAWNAVRIDGGDWKLLDACWGAGNVCDKRAERYEKKFSPEMFTMDNETFGERHYPENPRQFFRADGRVPSWAEYVVEKMSAPPVILYSNGPKQFIAKESMEPASQEIEVSRGDPNERIEFRLGRSCRHWTMDNQGEGLRPYPMMLQAVPSDGKRRGDNDMFDIEFDEPLWFWADVPRRRLGRPGDLLFCYAITTMDGRDLRGATMADYRARMGRCSMSMQAICSWKLV